MDSGDKLFETAVNFGLSEEKSRMYADVFQSIDTNHDGVISAEELHKVLQTLGFPSTLEQTTKMVEMVDENNDGLVDFSEFLHMAERNSLLMQSDDEDEDEEDIASAFKMFDINNDGMITMQELQQTMAKLGQPLSKNEAMEILRSMDENGDGLISFREFVSCWNQFLSNGSRLSF